MSIKSFFRGLTQPRGGRVNRSRGTGNGLLSRGLGKVKRSSGGISGNFRSAVINDAARRHRAGSASNSYTFKTNAGRRRVFSLHESNATKVISIVAFTAVCAIGLALIFISAGSGGRELEAAQTGTEQSEPTIDSSQAITVEDTGASVTVTIAGGIKLQDEVLTAAQTAAGHDFNNYLSELKSVLTADISIAGVVGTMDDSKPVAGYPKPNYPSQLAATLEHIGVNTAAVSTPGILTGGFDSLGATLTSLSGNGVVPIGAYTDAAASESVWVRQINGVSVGVGSYTCVTSAELSAIRQSAAALGVTDEQLGYCANMLDIKTAASAILADVSAMRAAGAHFVVVYLYWGSTTATSPSTDMRELAQDMIDAGVDVTVGIGPDFTQRVTKKKSSATGKNCYVLYSLGNLLSDVNSGANALTQQSIALTFTLERAAGSTDVSLAKAEFHPIFCHRDRNYSTENTYLKYRVLPAAGYVGNDVRPEIFTSDDQWNLCKTAFGNLRTLLSEHFVLGTPATAASPASAEQAVTGENTSL